MNIVKGKEISMWYATAMTIETAKNANRDGVKAKLLRIEFVAEDGGDPAEDVLFEENLSPEVFEVLENFVTDATKEKPVKCVSLIKFKKSEEAGEFMFKDLLARPGGCMIPYRFKKGKCYANDLDGKRTKDRWGKEVEKDELQVFCQISFIMEGENGKPETHWAKGRSPQEIGDRLERTFFKDEVPKVLQTVPPAETTPPDPNQPPL